MRATDLAAMMTNYERERSERAEAQSTVSYKEKEELPKLRKRMKVAADTRLQYENLDKLHARHLGLEKEKIWVMSNTMSEAAPEARGGIRECTGSGEKIGGQSQGVPG